MCVCMYVCVCVLACVYMHASTHTHIARLWWYKKLPCEDFPLYDTLMWIVWSELSRSLFHVLHRPWSTSHTRNSCQVRGNVALSKVLTDSSSIIVTCFLKCVHWLHFILFLFSSLWKALTRLWRMASTLKWTQTCSVSQPWTSTARRGSPLRYVHKSSLVL